MNMKIIYHLLANLYYSFITARNSLYSRCFVNKPVDFKSIPIVINNRNRYTFLKELVDFLIKSHYTNIYIIDNNSSYPQLLDYYEELKEMGIKIFALDKNLGFKALEMIPIYKKIKKGYYIYTDPDVLPVDECPDDFVEYFYNLLQKYSTVQKVGFSLKIDDLPNHFDKKQDVINWEKQLYKVKLEDGVYEAPVDTTFALHRPLSRISTQGRFKHIRTTFPYEARHLPWYNNSMNLSEEEKYYIDHVEIGTQWSKGIEVENISFYKFFSNWCK